MRTWIFVEELAKNVLRNCFEKRFNIFLKYMSEFTIRDTPWG